MDLTTIAFGFSTIVGLLSTFKQEPKSPKETSFKDFLKWIEDHNFGDIKEHLDKNSELQASIESIIREDNEVILKKLDKIDGVLAAFLSHVDGFGRIVTAMKPNAALSQQAISILRQVVKSGINYFQIIQADGRDDTLLIPNSPKEIIIDCPEPGFQKEDLRRLVELELLYC